MSDNEGAITCDKPIAFEGTTVGLEPGYFVLPALEVPCPSGHAGVGVFCSGWVRYPGRDGLDVGFAVCPARIEAAEETARAPSKKLPRNSLVLRNRLGEALWEANHDRKREVDAIFDTIEAYMAEQERRQVMACCKEGARLAEDWVEMYKCPIHGWQDCRPKTTPDQWVIVATHLSTEGVAYFWGPNFSGYTRNVDKAGRYTEAEAKSREKWTERMEVAVPLTEVLAAAQPHVPDDDAHRWFHRRFPNGRPERAPKEST